jgi:hypothetical protein
MDLHMAIHERIKGLPVGESAVAEMGRALEEINSQEWALGFRDRGMGYGDYAVIVKETDVLIVECPYYEIAKHIIKLHNESLKKES